RYSLEIVCPHRRWHPLLRYTTLFGSHGVGLEVHEAPTIGYGRTGKLASRIPVTVEPGVYLPGRGGVRIEDTTPAGQVHTRLDGEDRKNTHLNSSHGSIAESVLCFEQK